MQNMSAQERLRAAVRAGNQTALVELCLHLHDQVERLTQRLTHSAVKPATVSAVVLSQPPAASGGAGGRPLWDRVGTATTQFAPRL
jgi:hypothetical protein